MLLEFLPRLLYNFQRKHMGFPQPSIFEYEASGTEREGVGQKIRQSFVVAGSVASVTDSMFHIIHRESDCS